MAIDQQHARQPLNRGGNAVVGTCLLMAIFGLAGPPIGVIAALGPLGFWAAPLGYAIGTIPALIAGGTFSLLWLLGVNALPRSALTVIVGVAAAGLLSLRPDGHQMVLFTGWAAGVAGLVCCLLANFVIRSVERSRPTV